jgi:hypothetical protein
MVIAIKDTRLPEPPSANLDATTADKPYITASTSLGDSRQTLE